MTRQLSAGSRDDDALFTIIRSKAHRSRQFLVSPQIRVLALSY